MKKLLYYLNFVEHLKYVRIVAFTMHSSLSSLGFKTQPEWLNHYQMNLFWVQKMFEHASFF